MISGSTQLYGVLGCPIEHSLSPKLHNAVFAQRQLDAIYVPLKVQPDELGEAIQGIKALNIQGCNITLPHKEQSLHFVDVVPNAMDKAIGAINTTVLHDGRILGFNTDPMGFIEDLKEHKHVDPKGKVAVVLGAGGSSRAVCFALLENGVSKLLIHNRTTERAKGLVKYLKMYFEDKEVESLDSIDQLDKNQVVDLLINCTSCGMKEQDPYPINPEVMSKTKYVYDLIYVPKSTKLLAAAEESGVPCSNGLGMLVNQAVLAHRLWFPDLEKKFIYEIMAKEAQGWV